MFLNEYTNRKSYNQNWIDAWINLHIQKYGFEDKEQESRREGWTDARSAVGFCLGSGLFGSYNSD